MCDGGGQLFIIIKVVQLSNMIQEMLYMYSSLNYNQTNCPNSITVLFPFSMSVQREVNV